MASKSCVIKTSLISALPFALAYSTSDNDLTAVLFACSGPGVDPHRLFTSLPSLPC